MGTAETEPATSVLLVKYLSHSELSGQIVSSKINISGQISWSIYTSGLDKTCTCLGRDVMLHVPTV